MFYHAYNGYLNYAYPYDELQPLTCKGHDTWGSYSLTLIDAMDTLVVMGNHSEFRRIAQLLIDKGESFFDTDINASVFETNIRIVGGLLSAHLLMSRAEMVLEPAWPCSGPLLRMAENIARKILPAFDTPTGMPYGTVNLRHGVPKGETTVTCTAGVGTFLLEFGALSRLTGDPIFEKTAVRAIRALWKFRSPIGLLGNHIDVSTGKWTAMDSGIGGGVDSYFEYLVKGAIMFNVPEFLHMFREYEISIKRHLKRDDWYLWAHMTKGTVSLPLFTSLDGYWPSIQGMLGDIDEAMKTLHNFHQVWRQFGFTPEYYNIPNANVHQGREGYPLRPEIIESAMYLYRATKDPYLLEIGVDILEGIEQVARTSCGYATVKDVRDHRLEDRMESFFLAETAKYLYLLFDPDNFLHENGSYGEIRHTPGGVCILGAGGYVFNTEAHPMDLAAVHCCSAEKREDDRLLQDMEDNIDLLAMLGVTDERDNNEADGFWEEFKDSSRRQKEWALKEETLRHAREKYFRKQEEKNCQQGGTENCEKEDKSVSIDEEDDEDLEEEDEDEDDYFGFDDDSDEPSVKEEEVKVNKTEEHHHHTFLVDMTKFTELERNFTRSFMKELQITNLLKNISADLASKMRVSFQKTEYEHMANNVAKKLDSASLVEQDHPTNTNISMIDSHDTKEGTNIDKQKINAQSDLIIEDVSSEDRDEDIHDKIENQNNDAR
ncbi:LOW QUALITY PROTEIN: alpha-1,2-Mannosidase [Elysia marginata]|uniref:alpha-1,2-Mannosidase n=1 Tax=Elysia marginata TaxID=1093978 RepID=A0AAV4IJA0_9GAST|nr:LOW QUALITY PROTEIN: alpha-1,2-Mannosidase [Elysia marginata]